MSSSRLLSSPGFLSPCLYLPQSFVEEQGWVRERGTAGGAGIALSCSQRPSRHTVVWSSFTFLLAVWFLKDILRGEGTPAATVVLSCSGPILEFISCFLSAKKHIFHTSTSMRWEHIYTEGAFTWADGGRGFSVTWGTLSRRPVQILKSLLEGFWGAHTGGVSSEPCVGFVVQILRRTLLLPFTG